jgi:photosystem II stability/assembly factor-like uncharacterized protein
MRVSRALLAATAAALALAPSSLAQVPRASDYHSLLVSASNAKELLLGTHNGLFRSVDGGRTWKTAGLDNHDVMNLVQAGGTLWAAGHEVLAKSGDGGRTWTNVRPRDLPTLDVHGFAARPGKPNTLYAEIAGRGQYRSTDGGRTFQLLSKPPTGAGMIMGLSASSTGSLFAGDMQNGIFVSKDGRSWRQIATGMAMAVAVDPRNPGRVIATTKGVALSEDGGKSWQMALRSKVMFGPVAWSPHRSNLAYAVAVDRSLWRTTDGGTSWKKIG